MFKSERCYVAFIDILGFKNLVNNESMNDVIKLFRGIDYSNKHTGIYKYENYELKAVIPRNELHYRIMSDSVVIYINSDVKNALYGLILYCSRLQGYLLTGYKEPIMCRGGIALGELYADGEILFGKGLVKAYIFESQSAVYPRIVIPMNLVDECQDDTLDYHINEIVEIEGGFYTIDYIGELVNSNIATPEIIDKITVFLNTGLTTFDDLKIKEKYLYFDNKFRKNLEMRRKVEGG